jgi:hypothetical protein
VFVGSRTCKRLLTVRPGAMTSTFFEKRRSVG